MKNKYFDAIESHIVLVIGNRRRNYWLVQDRAKVDIQLGETFFTLLRHSQHFSKMIEARQGVPYRLALNLWEKLV